MNKKLQQLLEKTWDIIKSKNFPTWNVCDYEDDTMEPSQYIIDKSTEYYMTCAREAATILQISEEELDGWRNVFDEGIMELAAELRKS